MTSQNWTRHVRPITAIIIAGVLAHAAPTHAADEKVLNVYNWSDYIGEHVIENFQKRSGAKVNYDVFDANETLEAKLSAGSSGYDIAVPTLTPFLARGIKAGLYQKLDKSKLPNLKNLDPQLMSIMAKSDPGNEYAIPWVTATDALAYNVQKVRALAPDAPTDSWAMLLDPAWAVKFKGCGIEMLDSPTDIFPTTMHYLGIDPNSTNPADLDRAMEALYKIRPFVRKFDSSGYINDLANGDACVAFGFSTDIALANRRAKEAGKAYQIALVLPKEGTLTYIDTVAVPAGAPHFALAMQWMNFIMEPEQAADTTNTAGGRNGVPASIKFIKPDIASDPGLFPSLPVQKTFFTLDTSTPAFDRLRNRYWTRYKSGR